MNTAAPISLRERKAAPPHPAPIVYHQWHIHLLDEHGNSEACYAIVLGQLLRGDTWPELRAEIDRAAFPRLTDAELANLSRGHRQFNRRPA